MACVALLGCSAIVEPDTTRLGGGPSDPDAGSGPADPSDAGRTEEDAAPPPECTTERSRCEGEVLVTCEGGRETRVDCAERDSLCMGGRCEPRMCAPDSRECTADRTGLLVCNARGDRQTLTPCEHGCDPDASACATVSPACAMLPTIAIGSTELVDLCEEEDDDTHVPSDGCLADRRANVGDAAYVLTLAEPTDVEIEATDLDSAVAVDTLLYLRRACDEPASQLACSDDVPCESSTLPGTCSGVEVRQSRIVRRLDPGTYYLFVDGFAYESSRTRFDCGVVRLRVRNAR